jgi:hypothetical protein
MSLERIHVHIGAPKSGSTAVQRCLAESRERLAEVGIRYPEVSLRGWGHHDVAFLLGGGYPEWASPQPLGLDALQDQLRSAVRPGDRTLILSSEDFYLFPAPDRLAGWLEGALGPLPVVSIDAYLRPQSELLPSWYNQLVKAQGFAGTFEDSVSRDGHLWDYEAGLAPWARTFGDGALRVHAYPDGDVRTHYLSQIGAAGLVSPPVHHRQNRRLLRDILEYQRLVNRRPVPTAEKRRFHKRLIALSHAEPRPPALRDAPLVSATRLKELVARYRSSNAAVRARYRVGGNLDRSPSPETVPAPPDYRGPSAEAVALIEAWLAEGEP